MNDIKCFIINLEKDVEKKTEMLHICKINSIKPTFIKAVYGKELEKSYLDKVADQAKAERILGRKLTEGEIGVALSQLSIYQSMIDNDIELALILEDDVNFSFGQEDLKSIVKQLPSDWECVMLGHHTKRSRHIDALSSVWHQKKISQIQKLVRFAEAPVGAYGYLINKSGAHKMLAEYKVIYKPIDKWNDKKLNIYGVVPSMILVDDSFIGDSLLLRERSKVKITRTGYQKFKDLVQKILRKLRLHEVFFLTKGFFLQFKKLHKYEVNI
ncbi:glycosyltransferase family 25 protein [Sulfurimonas sp. CVO]|uniref:glycosyltransferase family 25 protein n=1 Tax=Sulfurimonas sp. CVO TaxID=2283483 RepID=UPI00132ECF72|nr:glycosyltransferase family 25 protein [Sulfurimonas sp. CVO]QHG91858.1 glycosyltransferase family 25 protein [Sulfurimonas sp. CVO]